MPDLVTRAGFEPAISCVRDRCLSRFGQRAMVEKRGLEPLTFCLQGSCAPSCATTPWSRYWESNPDLLDTNEMPDLRATTTGWLARQDSNLQHHG